MTSGSPLSSPSPGRSPLGDTTNASVVGPQDNCEGYEEDESDYGANSWSDDDMRAAASSLSYDNYLADTNPHRLDVDGYPASRVFNFSFQ
jgi:hypothetical protein